MQGLEYPPSASERGFSGGFEPQQPPSNGSGYPSAFPPGPYAPTPPPDIPSGHPFNHDAQSQPADGSRGPHGMHRYFQGDSVHHKASSNSAPQPAKIVGFFTRPGRLLAQECRMPIGCLGFSAADHGYATQPDDGPHNTIMRCWMKGLSCSKCPSSCHARQASSIIQLAA